MQCWTTDTAWRLSAFCIQLWAAAHIQPALSWCARLTDSWLPVILLRYPNACTLIYVINQWQNPWWKVTLMSDHPFFKAFFKPFSSYLIIIKVFVRHKNLLLTVQSTHICVHAHIQNMQHNALYNTAQHHTLIHIHTLTHWLPCKWTSEQGPPLLQLRSLRKGSTVLLKLAKQWWHFGANWGLTTDLSAPKMMGLPKGLSGLLGCTLFRFNFVYKYLIVFCALKLVFGTLLCVCACILWRHFWPCVFSG